MARQGPSHSISQGIRDGLSGYLSGQRRFLSLHCHCSGL